MHRYINAQKLLRYNLAAAEITPESESLRAGQYLEAYLDALKFGNHIVDTELQPADDLAILASQAHVSAWKASGLESHLFNAAAVLEYAISKSKQSYQIRLSLVRIYRLLCALTAASFLWHR